MYVITKKNVYEPANEVYFAYSLVEASNLMASLVTETGEEWLIAQVIE